RGRPESGQGGCPYDRYRHPDRQRGRISSDDARLLSRPALALQGGISRQGARDARAGVLHDFSSSRGECGDREQLSGGRVRRRKVLLVSPRPPRSDGKGDQRRAYEIREALSYEWDVEVLSWLPDVDGEIPLDLFTRVVGL